MLALAILIFAVSTGFVLYDLNGYRSFLWEIDKEIEDDEKVSNLEYTVYLIFQGISNTLVIISLLYISYKMSDTLLQVTAIPLVCYHIRNLCVNLSHTPSSLYFVDNYTSLEEVVKETGLLSVVMCIYAMWAVLLIRL